MSVLFIILKNLTQAKETYKKRCSPAYHYGGLPGELND